MPRYKVEPKEEQKKKRGNMVLRMVFLIALIVFLVSGGMLLNELVIQPWRANQKLNDYRNLKPNTSANLHTASTGQFVRRPGADAGIVPRAV